MQKMKKRAATFESHKTLSKRGKVQRAVVAHRVEAAAIAVAGGVGGEDEEEETDEKNFCFLTKNSTKSLVQAAATNERLENLETISLKFHQTPGEALPACCRPTRFW